MSFKKPTRRQVLLGSLATTVLAPLSYILSVTFGGYATRTGLKFLTSKEAAIAEALGEVMIPEENAIGVSIYQIDFANEVDRFLSVMPSHNRNGASLLFWIVEHLFPLRCFYFRKFTRLTIAERYKILSRFDESPSVGNRALVRGLKAFVHLIYYNHPKVIGQIEIGKDCTK